LGRAGGGSDEYRGSAAATKSVAARNDFMKVVTPVALIVLLTKNGRFVGGKRIWGNKAIFGGMWLKGKGL